MKRVRSLVLAATAALLCSVACAPADDAGHDDDGVSTQDAGLTYADGAPASALPADADRPAQDGSVANVADQGIATDVVTDEQCSPEGQTRLCDTIHPGTCSQGTQECTGGRWGPCVPDVEPGDVQQDCLGTLDDDCDGAKADTDADCRACEPNAEQNCDSQKPGICEAGTQQCKLAADGTWRWNRCVPTIAVGSQQEACTDPGAQQEDRDCDGRVAALDGDCNPCYDDVKNGTETDIDCGGACPNKCSESRGCAVNADCAQGNCFLGRCGPDLCVSGVKESHETDVDCGGECPDKCAQGETCATNQDCRSGRCQQNKCVVCSFSNPTATGTGACPPEDWACTYRQTDISGDGGRIKITCAGSGTYCFNKVAYSYIDLADVTANGSGACPPDDGLCSDYRQTDIAGDGSRIKVTCEASGTYCFNKVAYTYIDLAGATASGSGACPADSSACSDYRQTEISGDGDRIKIKCEGSGTYCFNKVVYAYIDLHPVESCQ